MTIQQRGGASIVIAAALIGIAGTLALPVANADIIRLSPTVNVDTGVEGADGSRRIFVTVTHDSISRINVRSTGHEQFERDVDNRVASFIVNREQTEVAIQECYVDFTNDAACQPFFTFYPYGKPAPAAEQVPPALDYKPCPDGHTFVADGGVCPEPPRANPNRAKAIGDVNVFSIAHDDVPDPETGVAGALVATLTDGQLMLLQRPCDSGWCLVKSVTIPGGTGFVRENQLKFG